MDSIFDEIDSKRIAPQRFSLAIFGCIVAITLQFFDIFSDNGEEFLTLVGLVAYLSILTSLNSYLNNFNYSKAIFWTKFKITMCLGWIAVYVLILMLEHKMIHISAENHFLLYFISHLVPGMLFVLTTLEFMSMVPTGLAYRLVKEEPTKLIRKLGFLNAFILPLPYLVFNTLLILNAYGRYSTVHLVLIKFLLGVFLSMPLLVIGLVFHKVNKIQRA